MRKNFLRGILLLFILCFGKLGFTQGIEFGLFLGASNYYGDLSNDAIMLDKTSPAVAIIGRYNLGEKWALKGFVGYGHISGDDKNANTPLKKSRNLSFQSDIYEASIQLEYNLIRNSYRYATTNKVIPYLFAGLGVFNFNPKAVLNGETLELQPLGTEGQGTTTYNDREKYALTQLCIPMGIGFKKKMGKRFSVGLEVGVRYTYTNYLDDIGGVYADPRVIERSNGRKAALLSDRSWQTSQDGLNVFKDEDKRSMKSIDINDMYFMGGLTITYIFPNAGIKCPKF